MSETVSYNPATVPHDGWDLPENPKPVERPQLVSEREISDRYYAAREQLSFVPSPELMEAVEGYYQDHYGLANMIDTCLSEPEVLSEEEKQQEYSKMQQVVDDGYIYMEDQSTKELAEYGLQLATRPQSYLQAARSIVARLRMARLEDPSDMRLRQSELAMLMKATETLFAEPSAAVTTVGQKEVRIVADIHDRVLAKVETSGLFGEAAKGSNKREIRPLDTESGKREYTTPSKYIYDALIQSPSATIESAQALFWKEARFAGQLLFHNTTHFDAAWMSSRLAPRRMQEALFGKVNIQTAANMGNHHHAPTVHWSEQYDPHTYKNVAETGIKGSTLAVPMAEIIQSAPFGRDAQYGVVRVDRGSADKVMPKVPVAKGIAYIGAGANDFRGEIGIDRTFYKTGKNVSNDIPVTEAPDGYVIDLDEHAYCVQHGEREADGERYYGYGEHYPKRYYIERPSRPTSLGYGEDWKEWKREEKRRTSEAIDALQRKSIEAYGEDALVIPLRTGVVEFFVPDDMEHNLKERANFSKLPTATTAGRVSLLG